MLNLNTQGEKLKQSANYIKVKSLVTQILQKEVSDFKEKINHLEFELSTLRLLEQYIQQEQPKQDEINEDRVFETIKKEREKQEALQKIQKLQKELQDLKENNQELQTSLKNKDNLTKEMTDKHKSELLKKQQELETCQADLEAINKLYQILKKKDEENFPIISEGSNNNSPISEKKFHELQKLQIENQRLKNESQQLKKEYDNLTNIFNDLVKERHKQEEDNQQSVRDWKTKYDQIAKLRESDNENFQTLLEDKSKVIGNLQQKLYQVQKEMSEKETQTNHFFRQKDSSISFGLDDEQLDQLDKTLEVISVCSVTQIANLCEKQSHQNELLKELKRIIEETLNIVPTFCQIELDRLKLHIQYLEKQISTLYKKWKYEKEKKNNLKQQQKRFVSVPEKLDEYDAQQKVQDAQKNLIHRLKVKQNESKLIIGRLEGQITQLQEQYRQQMETKQKEKEQLIKANQKLNEDLQKVTELKQKFKLENDSLMKDLESTVAKMQKKEEQILEMKQKNEEKNNEIKQLEFSQKKATEVLQQELNQKIQERDRIIEQIKKENETLTQQNKQLEEENFEQQQEYEKLYQKCCEDQKQPKQKSYVYKG